MQSNRRSFFSPIRLLVLSVIFIGVWLSVAGQGKNEFEVTYFDVGQGDSALVELENGQNILIDGGPDKKILEKLGQEIPFYKNKIDFMVLSHPHADHLNGLVHVLRKYTVGRVFVTDAVHTTPEYEEFLRILKEKKIPATKITERLKITSGDMSGVFLGPTNTEGKENLNDTSAVFMVTHDDEKFLFPGDLEIEEQKKLLKRYPDIKINYLKVPHHGSRDAFLEDFYTKTGVRIAIIPVGANKYGHPSGELLKFLESQKIRFFRTDAGNIKVNKSGVFQD